MKIITTTKNLELTKDLGEYVDKKVGLLEKFIDILKRDEEEKGKSLAEVYVEVGKETNHHNKGPFFSCRLEAGFPGKYLVSRAQNEDLYKAILEAKDEMEREIKKYKFKKFDKNRREKRKAKQDLI